MGEGDSFFWVEEITGEAYVPVGMKRKARTRKMEFVGWGSRPLIEFLESIGVDTSKKISQYDVTDIVNKYIKEHNLHHPQKKKRILSDERLLSLFGRKTIAKNKVYELLGTHFAENQEESDDDLLFSSEEDGNTSERQKNMTSERKTQIKKKVVETPKSCFAAIIPDNIKRIYLRRTLVQNLLKEPEAFERKIIGSFVRVKSDPHDYLQKNSHMLVQVIGWKKASDSDGKSGEIILQVSNFMKDVSISMLSDENFSEEECQDLRQRIRDGLLKRPTLVELEEKVQVLHEDITKHYLERRQLLQTPDEQSRLLREVPEVIADDIEAEVTPHDFPVNMKKVNNNSPESTINGGSDVLKFDGAAKGTVSAWISFGADSAELRRHEPVLKEEQKQPTEICIWSNNKAKPVNGVQKKSPGAIQVIDLSDDEENEHTGGDTSIADHDVGSFMWHYADPQGDVQGPFSIASLKRWSDADYFPPNFKVWMTGQSRKDAISLSDILHSIMHE
ncbi:protein binding protein, putative [Ricinus communis]|uniref:Protein binding protein, putative n=1 Tax=Ricinus communis TaxID=3988 RepID=B9SS21_RICCO|nr:protein binding protein, putative [Ricinus communis]